ncbi:hypothetical protein [Acrocarpospora sp. B8E8]|uniref:hypothetical protein n=1 Tax=Acrocarpospora sp. B8E8 TaxID=3153572 RepID=UPI00325D0A34
MAEEAEESETNATEDLDQRQTDEDDDDNVSFKKVKERRLEKELDEKYGTNPHELKEDELGRGAKIARFDVYHGSDGYYWLSKDGKARIQTDYRWD